MDARIVTPESNTELRQALLDEAPRARGVLVRDRYGKVCGYIPGTIVEYLDNGLAKFRPDTKSPPITIEASEYREW